MRDREEIALGVVGAGLYGRVHIEAYLRRARQAGDVRVVAFAEIDDAARRAAERDFGVKGYASARDMLLAETELDGVTVATPDHLHHAPVMACLAAGKHVFVEKPLATDVSQALEMAEAAERGGLLLQVDFHKRFDPYHIDLKLRIRNGELGAVQYGYCWMEDVLRVGTDMICRPHWGGMGSPGWFLGTHMIDLSWWLMDRPDPVTVFATGRKGKLRSLGIDMDDSVTATVVYANGAAVTCDTSVALPNSHEAVGRQGVKMVGSDGFLEVDSQYRGARGCSTGAGMRTPNCGGFGPRFDRHGGVTTAGYLDDSITDFVDNLLELKKGRPLAELAGSLATAREGVVVTRIVAAVHESLAQGVSVPVRNA